MIRSFFASVLFFLAFGYTASPTAAQEVNWRELRAQCDAGAPEACGTFLDALKAECHGGSSSDCLGWRVQSKKYAGEDSDQYAEALYYECIGKRSYLCSDAYEKYKGTHRERAGRFAFQACIRGDADLCRPFDDMDTQDPAKIRDAKAEACMRGAIARICDHAATEFYQQMGAANPITRDLSGQACMMDSPGGCQTHAIALAAIGDASGAQSANDKACSLGRRRSCNIKMQREAAEAQAQRGPQSADFGQMIADWTRARSADYNACTKRYGVNGCYLYKSGGK